MTFKFINFLRSRKCEHKTKESGFIFASKTEVDGTLSCTIGDDQHEQVIELANTRGYQVAYDIKLSAEKERILFSKNTRDPAWSSKDSSVRLTGRIDTPRKARSLRYDDDAEKRSKRYMIERRSDSPGPEQITGETRFGAAEGSENNSDPNDSGKFEIKQNLNVKG